MNCCKKLTSGVTTAVFLWNLFLSGRCVAARLRDVRSLDQTHEYIAKAHISAYVQCVFCFEPFCRFHSMIIAIMYVCNVYVACVCVCACLCLCDLRPYPLFLHDSLRFCPSPGSNYFRPFGRQVTFSIHGRCNAVQTWGSCNGEIGDCYDLMLKCFG